VSTTGWMIGVENRLRHQTTPAAVPHQTTPAAVPHRQRGLCGPSRRRAGARHTAAFASTTAPGRRWKTVG